MYLFHENVCILNSNATYFRDTLYAAYKYIPEVKLSRHASKTIR